MTAPLPGGRAPIVVVTTSTPLTTGFGVQGAGYLRVGAPGDDAGVVLLLKDRATVERLAEELLHLSLRMGIAQNAGVLPAVPMPPRLRAVPRA